MLIHGYTVDKNLPAFRKAFFLPDILTELDNQFAIWKWVSDMCDLPHLPQTIKDRFSRLLAALSDFFGQEEYRSDWKIDQTVCFEHNAELHKQLLDCEKKINHEMKTKFQCVSYIILELLEIADYTATEQDLSIFLEYLQKKVQVFVFKVLLNQMFYVILQEDGSLVHNLRFCTELPSVPVRDVTLNQEDIRWTPME